MKRLLIGFIHRVAYATLCALFAWHACTLPFGESAAQLKIAIAVCYTFNTPTAIVGRITGPYRGMDTFLDKGTWCDFCTPQEMLWYHIRFAVPVYVALFTSRLLRAGSFAGGALATPDRALGNGV